MKQVCIRTKEPYQKLLGLTVEVKLPGLKIGDLCYIETATGEQNLLKLLHLKVKSLNYHYFFWMETELVREVW